MHIRFMSILTLVTSSALFAASTPSAPMQLITVAQQTDCHYKTGYIRWPEGARVKLGAGECGILIQANTELGPHDTFEIINSPARIVNNLCKSLAGYVALHHGTLDPAEREANKCHLQTFCKESIVQVLTDEHDGLLSAYLGVMSLEKSPRIITLAIALAHKGMIYHAESRWDGISDVLMPFTTINDIQLNVWPVRIGTDFPGGLITYPRK
jgi:hypothetical protein